MDYAPQPRRRKNESAITQPIPAPADPAGRREMDALLINVLRDQIDAVNEQVAELTRTIRGYNGTPGLTHEMIQIKTLLEQLAPKVNALHQHYIDQRAEKPAAPEAAPAQKPLTIESLAKLFFVDIFKPLFIMAMAYLLFTLGPQLLVLLGAHKP